MSLIAFIIGNLTGGFAVLIILSILQIGRINSYERELKKWREIYEKTEENKNLD